MANLSNIIIHCSDSTFGSAAEIRHWHLANGWKDIGYHFVILNGQIVGGSKPKALYLAALDGSIEIGRPLDGDSFLSASEVGAHALGYNATSIGICLIGKSEFTTRQMQSLLKLLVELRAQYSIPSQRIMGHYQVSKGRACPNFDVPAFINAHPELRR